VRVFHPEDWAEPDDRERRMAGGASVPLPEEFREWHAYRRWVEASNAWYRQHPEADNRLDDLLDRRRQRLGRSPTAPGRR
jgi:hypothetical protein